MISLIKMSGQSLQIVCLHLNQLRSVCKIYKDRVLGDVAEGVQFMNDIWSHCWKCGYTVSFFVSTHSCRRVGQYPA
jgi:hypothetical protein